MRISRFYINPASHRIPASGAQMELPAEVAHHLTHVLRAEVGSEVVLFDGNGGEHRATVSSKNKKAVSVLVVEHDPVDRESSIDITLAQSVVTGAKMDLVIQKAVELGAKRIIPIVTERCTVRLDDKRIEKRIQHWQGVIESASEQCGRTRLPVLEKVTPLFPWAEELNEKTVNLFLQPNSELTLGKLKIPDQVVLALIGPEGGFSDNELGKMTSCGLVGVSLGKRILRTETAGLAVLAAMQTLWGDFN